MHRSGFRILKNLHINRYRKDRRSPDTVDFDQVEEFYDSIAPEEETSRHRNPEEAYMDKTVDPLIQEAINSLPDEYRAVVLLNFVEDLSYKEIATVLDVPMGTVMSRLHRARKILQRKLAPRRPTDGDGRIVDMDDYRKTGEAG